VSEVYEKKQEPFQRQCQLVQEQLEGLKTASKKREVISFNLRKIQSQAEKRQREVSASIKERIELDHARNLSLLESFLLASFETQENQSTWKKKKKKKGERRLENVLFPSKSPCKIAKVNYDPFLCVNS